jgi:tetratricopeptide (TPR) repeat protein
VPAQARPVEKVPEQAVVSDPSSIALEKEEAEERLADFLRVHNELEAKGANKWGGYLYAEMVQLSLEADSFFMKRDFNAASQRYLAALGKANDLLSQTQEVLRRLMEEGTLALEEGNGDLAKDKLSLALLIDPTNEYARHTLKRAEVIGAVMQLLASGRSHEQENRFSFALADYQEALRLDPESKKARKAFERVKGLIAADHFRALMSTGLAAYHDQDFGKARAELLKAQSYRPDSTEVQAALLLVEEASRRLRIERLQKDALAAEQVEDWERALQSYQDVLEIDSSIHFATKGKDRSLQQIWIAKRLTFYLDSPEVLESEQHLQNALQLLQEVTGFEPKGPRLVKQLETLDQLITIARTPVKVIIESDSLTEVAVYKVGKLGRFDVRDLHLRPGTYTVVGARDGYQDVRQRIVVRSKAEPLRISVVCKVKI